MIHLEQLEKLIPLACGGTNLPLPDKHAGKVRDAYRLDQEHVLFVTTDRLSAFDRVLAQVPFKGQVLNQLAAWWFEYTGDIISNHVIDLPDPNALVALAVKPFPVEVIVRGFITGVTSTALWHRYSLGERDIYGYIFPEGLRKNQVLSAPIITPTTKGGPTGHDERLTCAEVVERGLLDDQTWQQIQQAALAIFARGQLAAQKAGLILVDTKYEFGRASDGRVLLIDEIHTPDSSRFWLSSTYPSRLEAGEEPENYDKEFVRLAYVEKGYRGDGEPPLMPASLWAALGQRYIQIYELLTGKSFEPGEYPLEDRLVKNLRKTGWLG